MMCSHLVVGSERCMVFQRTNSLKRKFYSNKPPWGIQTFSKLFYKGCYISETSILLGALTSRPCKNLWSLKSFVPRIFLSLRYLLWEILSLRHFIHRNFCLLGHFVPGMFFPRTWCFRTFLYCLIIYCPLESFVRMPYNPYQAKENLADFLPLYFCRLYWPHILP